MISRKYVWKDSYLFYNFIIDDGILRGGAFDISKFVDVFFFSYVVFKNDKSKRGNNMLLLQML